LKEKTDGFLEAGFFVRNCVRQSGSGGLPHEQQQKKSQDNAGDANDKKCISPAVGVCNPTASKVAEKDT
jgi:hypothetical protein